MSNFKYALIILAFFLCGCSKQNEWLNVKRDRADVMPSTIRDFQAILNNTNGMNIGSLMIGLESCDNFYVPNENVGSLSQTQKNIYLWNKIIWEPDQDGGYSAVYERIAFTNIVLDGMEKLERLSENEVEYDNVKGQALFFRSFLFYSLANVFCKTYNKNTALSDLGICLRRTSDINHIEPRSSIQQTYDQIIGDLKNAASLLPTDPLFKTRPSKPAAFSLIAKTYLIMQDYENAKIYADSCLLLIDSLLDFNSNIVSLNVSYRFPDLVTGGNSEMILYVLGGGGSTVSPAEFNISFVDSVLYKKYVNNDLRKSYFFAETSSGQAKFRGSYSGTYQGFSGIATNEVYFIRVECNARLNNVEAALADLNKVLIKRYKAGTYVDITANNSEEALAIILEERRKEFPFTSQIRWEDLRRLNEEGKYSKTLYRNFEGATFSLPPNDPRYVFPFTSKEIIQTGTQQNER